MSNGKKAHLYTLKAGDIRLCVSSFGAAWTSLTLPASKGGKSDVLLGYSNLDGYIGDAAYMGATIGRYAGRISGARFTIEGIEHELGANEPRSCLHGGARGFGARLWKSEAYEESDGVFVRFELESPDGDGGFPGNLVAAVSYGITKTNEIVAVYEATCDAPCPINLANHAYFNLSGDGGASILGHEALIHASSYVETDGDLIPTGQLLPVKDGAFDFRARKPIGRDMGAAPGGYDHCFAIDGDPGDLRLCAEFRDPASGRAMIVYTTQPGAQFYTGNKLAAVRGKAGAVYGAHSGFCLETQRFPDSPNRPEFPSCVFGPERPYVEKSAFAFEIE